MPDYTLQQTGKPVENRWTHIPRSSPQSQIHPAGGAPNTTLPQDATGCQPFCRATLESRTLHPWRTECGGRPVESMRFDRWNRWSTKGTLMALDEMAQAHRRDYQDLDRVRALQHAIDTYVSNAPARTSPQTLKKLQAAAEALGKDATHIVKVWD